MLLSHRAKQLVKKDIPIPSRYISRSVVHYLQMLTVTHFQPESINTCQWVLMSFKNGEGYTANGYNNNTYIKNFTSYGTPWQYDAIWMALCLGSFLSAVMKLTCGHWL